MKNNEILKRVLDQNKDVLENTFKAAAIVQEKGEKITEQILDNATYLPKEVRELNQRWFTGVKEVRENIRETLLKGHEQLENLVTTG